MSNIRVTASGEPVTGTTGSSKAPIVVLGLPRAGTTWVAGVIGRAAGATPLHEPDNAKLWPAAVPCTEALGRFPVLGPDDLAPAYFRLWDTVLHGPTSAPPNRERVVRRLWGKPSKADLEAVAQGRPPLRLLAAGRAALASRCLPSGAAPGECRVVKSVHAGLALEWFAKSFQTRVVVVVRHPANVLASWLELELPDRDRQPQLSAEARERYGLPPDLPAPLPGPLGTTVWQLGLLLTALERAAANHPEWHVVDHDEFCTSPDASFQTLLTSLGLPWTEATESFLRQQNRPGRDFEPAREAATLPQSWRARLTRDQVDALQRGLRPFPLQRWRAAEFTETR